MVFIVESLKSSLASDIVGENYVNKTMYVGYMRTENGELALRAANYKKYRRFDYETT